MNEEMTSDINDLLLQVISHGNFILKYTNLGITTGSLTYNLYSSLRDSWKQASSKDDFIMCMVYDQPSL